MSIIKPVQEQERKRRGDEKGEYQQPKVARVLCRGVEQLVAAHQVLGRLLRL